MTRVSLLSMAVLSVIVSPGDAFGEPKAKAPGPDVVITQGDCVAAKLGTDIPAAKIGEPVSAVTLNTPVWVPAAGRILLIAGSTAAWRLSTPKRRTSISPSLFPPCGRIGQSRLAAVATMAPSPD